MEELNQERRVRSWAALKKLPSSFCKMYLIAIWLQTRCDLWAAKERSCDPARLPPVWCEHQGSPSLSKPKINCRKAAEAGSVQLSSFCHSELLRFVCAVGLQNRGGTVPDSGDCHVSLHGTAHGQAELPQRGEQPGSTQPHPRRGSAKGCGAKQPSSVTAAQAQQCKNGLLELLWESCTLLHCSLAFPSPGLCFIAWEPSSPSSEGAWRSFSVSSYTSFQRQVNAIACIYTCP